MQAMLRRARRFDNHMLNMGAPCQMGYNQGSRPRGNMFIMQGDGLRHRSAMHACLVSYLRWLYKSVVLGL